MTLALTVLPYQDAECALPDTDFMSCVALNLAGSASLSLIFDLIAQSLAAV